MNLACRLRELREARGLSLSELVAGAYRTDVAGLVLLPLGNAGIMPRGLNVPSNSEAERTGAVYISAETGEVTIDDQGSTVNGRRPLGNGYAQYRGEVAPRRTQRE